MPRGFLKRLRKVWVISVLLFAAYVSGYGVLRWRRVLVRYEYFADLKQGPLICEIAAGHDLRDHGVGAIKNVLAQPLAVMYAPLCWLEGAYWNSR